MAVLGTFRKDKDGFAGTISTLTGVSEVRIAPISKASPTMPDFRLYRGPGEVGAAWKKKAKDDSHIWLAVTLDDPAYPRPIQARLVLTATGSEAAFGEMVNEQRSAPDAIPQPTRNDGRGLRAAG